MSGASPQQRASAELAAWRRWRVGRRQRFQQAHLRNQRLWSGCCLACGMALPQGERRHQFCPAMEVNGPPAR